jgi:hypothetical protein
MENAITYVCYWLTTASVPNLFQRTGKQWPTGQF